MTKIIVMALLLLSPVLYFINKDYGPSSEYAHALRARDAVTAKCDEMIGDSALGNERRQTRAICEQAIAIAQQHADELARGR